jgi:hypothetical protein
VAQDVAVNRALYIIDRRQCTGMSADDVTKTLDVAVAAFGYDNATVQHKPNLSELARRV